MNSKHMRDWLAFSEWYLCNPAKWDHIIYTDEKRFNLDGPDGFQYYWHNLKKEPEQFWSRQNGGGGVIICAGFSKHSKSELFFCEGKINCTDYVLMFSTILLPYAHATYGTKDFILQHDNATIHTSTETKTFFKKRKLQCLTGQLNPWISILLRIYGEFWPEMFMMQVIGNSKM